MMRRPGPRQITEFLAGIGRRIVRLETDNNKCASAWRASDYVDGPGDLIVGIGPGNVARHPAPAENGKILEATGTGIRWITPTDADHDARGGAWYGDIYVNLSTPSPGANFNNQEAPGAPVIYTWTVREDPDGLLSSTDNTAIIIPIDGLYAVNAVSLFTPDSAGGKSVGRLWITRNNDRENGRAQCWTSVDDNHMHAFRIGKLSAGDEIRIELVAGDSAAPAYGTWRTELSVGKLGDAV